MRAISTFLGTPIRNSESVRDRGNSSTFNFASNNFNVYTFSYELIEYGQRPSYGLKSSLVAHRDDYYNNCGRRPDL